MILSARRTGNGINFRRTPHQFLEFAAAVIT
jgi:hypothetical protein